MDKTDKTSLAGEAEFVLRLAYKKTGRLEEARELAQETLLAALAALARGTELVEPRAFLTSLLSRKWADLLRRKYRRPTLSLDTLPDLAEEGEPFLELEKREEAEALRRELAALTASTREVMARRYLRGESVGAVAKALGLPEGTVKRRLFEGREEIKRRLDGMEAYEKRSVSPERLHVTCSGRPGLNDEPFTLMKSLLHENLLLAAYPEPVGVGELARAIGVPAAYVEPIVEELTAGELMKKVGNKVYTDFIIYREAEEEARLPPQRALASASFGLFWEPVGRAVAALGGMPWVASMEEGAREKLFFYAALRLLESGVYVAGERIYGGKQVFPDRPNGGRWIAFGYAGEADRPHSAELAAQSYSGERHAVIENLAGVGKLTMRAYDTALEKTRYLKGPYPCDDREILLLLALVLRGEGVDDAGVDGLLLENLPHLADCGLLSRREGGYSVALPILTAGEYAEFSHLCAKAVEEFADQAEEILAAHLAHARIVLPAHLKSVPLQKQYLPAVGSLPVLLLREAIGRGALPESGLPRPPMLLVRG